MNIKKFIKFEIKLQKINYYFYILISLAAVIILIIVSLFLYKNFYLTITQSDEILILKEKVASETVDMEKFNNIMKKIEKKNKARELGKINNPFR